MFYRIIFVLAIVCVVNASVLTVNVFDDDPETEVASNPKDCNFQACDQLCRRLKFPGGACVNGRCKCDNFLNAEDEVSEETISDLEDSVLQKDVPEAEVAANPRRCNLKVCDLVCRWLNKTSGSCVDGRCKCAKPLIAEDDMTEAAQFLSPGGCDFKACAQQCFRLGYPGGACVNGRCKCDKFLNTEDPMTDPAESVSPSSCNSIACDDQCRRTGWHSGVCINGQCKCDYFLKTEVSENSLPNLEDSVSPRKCTHQECNAQCRRLMFREGVCIAGRCSCNNYFPIPKDTMNYLEESISLDDNFLSAEDEISDDSLPVSKLSEDQTERGCNMRACDQLCRRLKFPGGACVNGRCKCDNFFRTEDAVNTEFALRRVCRLTKCNRKCIRRGYEGATCVNGRCKCYNNLQEKDEISETSLPVFELSEDQPERSCNLRACDQLCRRLKFPGGVCVNGRCKCDIFFGTEDASPLNDVNSDESEETEVVLRTNEEELIVPSPSACNTVNCNQMCRRLKYAGGWCRFGQCQCY